MEERITVDTQRYHLQLAWVDIGAVLQYVATRGLRDAQHHICAKDATQLLCRVDPLCEAVAITFVCEVVDRHHVPTYPLLRQSVVRSMKHPPVTTADADARRDYYVLETSQGQRAWAYTPAGERDGWMLHGWFA